MKKYIIIVILIITLTIMVGCSGNNHEGQAKTPSGSSAQNGRMYEDVVKDFEEHGFTNIRTKKMEDLITGWLTEDGEVEKVTVDGDENYSSDEWVPEDTEVVIYYHTFPEEEQQTVEPEMNETTTESITTATQKKDTISDADYKKLDSFVGKKCYDVTDDIKKTGYTPIYLAANTREDMTTDIEWQIEDGYTEGEWIITSMIDTDSEEKTVTYIVTSKWMRDNLY